MIKTEIHRIEKLYGETKAVSHTTKALNMEGRIALKLIEQWGMISSCPDGMDAAGRAQSRLMTPAEVVSRSLAIASIFMESADHFGLLEDVPVPPEPTGERR